MVALETPICNFGEKAPDFSLTATDQQSVTLDQARGPKGLLVMFLCNHCPFVKAIIDVLVEDCRQLQTSGLGVIAIMSNDTKAYPADSFDNMKLFAKAHSFSFPYVIDEDQSIAKAYGAVCTPDFFGYNAQLGLQYRGRLDASRMQPIPNAKRELLEAMLQIADTGKGPKDQIPSMGCSIKWKK